ncbi:MAG: insulinase family protein [Calditrichaeota bacterium]|nr:insulinase family protein [Calditrichota bacterium]
MFANSKNVNEGSLYRKTVLPNGLRVISEKIPYVRSVSIGLWIEAGTRDEPAQKNGIAHFLEHMVFKGTKTRSAFKLADTLEALGGALNAFTGKELTSFYAHVLDEHLEVAVDILADLLENPLLDPQDIEKEKNVVIEEIRDLEDAPDDLIFDYFFQDIFSNHPLSFPILGQEKIVREFERRDLIEFKENNYTSNRIIIAAAGNIDHQQLVDLAGKYFSGIKTTSQRELLALPEERPERHIRTYRAQQAHVCMGCRTVPYSAPEKYPLLLVNTILGAGMSSRLFQTLREKYGLVYSVFSFTDFFMDTGVFGIYFGTDKGNIDQAIELTANEFNRLLNKELQEDELAKRQSQLKGNLLLGLESTSNRMERLAKMEIYFQGFQTLDDVIQSINEVTLEDIFDVAESYFNSHRIYQTIIRPQ